MEGAKSQLPATMDATVVDDTELSEKHERFAQAWARLDNRSAAYREVYEVHPRTAQSTVWKSAYRLASNPKIAARHKELMEEARLRTVITIADALQWQFDIATADPNEISSVIKRACRYCFGIEHRFQWVDDNEYLIATVEAIDKKKPSPSDEGGYGYSRAIDPHPDCPKCLGNGEIDIVVNDTTKITGKARKLFKGIDYKNGQWVITMHDQQKAWEMVCRMLGAFKDNLQVTDPNKATKIPDGTITEKDAARSYQELIG